MARREGVAAILASSPASASSAAWFNRNGPPPGSNFQYSGWTTEANHLGNVAYRTGKRIEWDHRAMHATNAPEADPS